MPGAVHQHDRMGQGRTAPLVLREPRHHQPGSDSAVGRREGNELGEPGPDVHHRGPVEVDDGLYR